MPLPLLKTLSIMTTSKWNLPLYFAPLQGYTDRVYRAAHLLVAGGVTAYFTPFLRWEQGGVRARDLRDLQVDGALLAALPGEVSESRLRASWVPQIIAADVEEMARLCDVLQGQGWSRIDLNMGCPFPMQVHRGRGSGLLPWPDRVEALLREAARRGDCQFSVKMRIGQERDDEGMALLPMLNDSCLCGIALHPRLGCRQYKGSPDLDAFRRFYEQCRKPIVYNGDITTAEQAWQIAEAFPRLAGLMIGRGLLAQPLLAQEVVKGKPFSEEERQRALLRLHDAVWHDATARLQGDSQILTRLHAFWDYPNAMIDKKTYKQLRKSTTLRQYEAALQGWRNGKGMGAAALAAAAADDRAACQTDLP